MDDSSGLIPADSVNRCTRVGQSGQCPDQAMPGTDFCERHTHKLAKLQNKHRQYDLDDARFRMRMDQFAGSEAIYSMREEIALCRQFIEGLIGSLKIDDSPESRATLMVHAPMVVKLSETLERLVKTSGTMEVRFGQMLAKDAVYKLAGRLVEILSEEISHVDNYEHIIDQVTSRIADEIDAAKNNEENDD